MLRFALTLALAASALAQEEPPPADPPADTAAAPQDAADAALQTDLKEPFVSEPETRVTEKVEDRVGLVAPCIGGATGLFRLRTAEAGPRNTFRIGVHGEFFQSDDFLVQDDSHQRFIGTFTAAYTFHEFVEAFLAFTSASNENGRDDPTRRDAEVILALGDMALGAKAQLPVGKGFAFGPEFAVKLLNAVGGSTADLSGTSAQFGAVASLDLKKARDVPFRAHLNVGYLLDRSRELCPPDEDSSPCAVFLTLDQQTDRLVAEFGYGVNRSRFQLGVGVDVPLMLDSFGLQPLLEYHLDVATGDADALYAAAFGRNPSLADEIDGHATQSLTLGVRARPARGLFIDVGWDQGLESPGFGFGPAVPRWNLILGVAYNFDPRPSGVTRTVTKEVVKAVPSGGTPGEPSGRIRGRLVDASTKGPIEGAIVTFPGKDLTGLATDPDGGFLSYTFPVGDLLIVVRHPKYEPAKVTANVLVDEEVPLDLELEPAAPEGSVFSGRVTDADGSGLAALVRVAGPVNTELQTDAGGAFQVELSPGEYVARVEAQGHLTKERAFAMVEGGAFSADFVLSSRPEKPNVVLTSRKIQIRQKIHFATGRAEIEPDSKELLDEMVELLANHPEVKLVRIEGHTDNRGNAQANVDLSQARAEAVREYLIEQGTDPERLTAKGYGPAKPIAPNFAARGREKNRRVEFKILKKG